MDIVGKCFADELTRSEAKLAIFDILQGIGFPEAIF